MPSTWIVTLYVLIVLALALIVWWEYQRNKKRPLPKVLADTGEQDARSSSSAQ